MDPPIIMMQLKFMIMNAWHYYRPRDLITISLYIQIAIRKMQLCLLSRTCLSMPYNPTATMGHSIHNTDISLTMPSALYSENQHSSIKRTSPQCAKHVPESLHTQISYGDELQSGGGAPDENNEHTDVVQLDTFWGFVQKFFCYANWLIQQLSGWLISHNHGGEDARCVGPRLA